MLQIPPPQFRRRRGRGTPPAQAALPAVLTLVEASYVAGTLVRLVFDRPIDIGGIDGAAIVVIDGPGGLRYEAQGTPVLVTPETLEVGLLDVLPAAGPDVRLDATAANGIVAVGPGGAWAGVANLLLPYP